jgi:hypothetical protein
LEVGSVAQADAGPAGRPASAHPPPLSRRMATRRLAATRRRCQQGLAAICCPMLQAQPPHKKSQAILPRRPPRTANPLSPLPPRGLRSPYRPQQHAVFVLRAEALRTCRAAQSLHASLGVCNRRLCVAFARLLSPPFALPCPPPGDRLEGPPYRNGFYSHLPAIPVALISNKPAPWASARYCQDPAAVRHRSICQPRYHSLPSAPASTGLLVAVLLALPTTDSISDAISLPRHSSSRPQQRPSLLRTRLALLKHGGASPTSKPKPRLRSARTRLLVLDRCDP